MAGTSSGGGGKGRGLEAACGLAGVGEGAAAVVDARIAVPCAGADATSTGVGDSLAPHIPQKRFSSEFSFPQRGQRNPSSSCLL
jgi:hypothetical protein